jgi:hypothetical protein
MPNETMDEELACTPILSIVTFSDEKGLFRFLGSNSIINAAHMLDYKANFSLPNQFRSLEGEPESQLFNRIDILAENLTSGEIKWKRRDKLQLLTRNDFTIQEIQNILIQLFNGLNSTSEGAETVFELDKKEDFMVKKLIKDIFKLK